MTWILPVLGGVNAWLFDAHYKVWWTVFTGSFFW